MRMEKAKALREELDGVRTRSRRLLAKGNRLIERGVQLKDAAERAMLGNEINKEDEARRLIDEALTYAEQIDCRNIHVMAGITEQSQAAEQTFQSNLSYAAQQAEQAGKTILIEPLNHRDVQSYHLQSVEAAARTIDAVGSDRVKIMFDFYHIQILQGDLLNRFKSYLPYIGHVQIAGVPQRAEPDRGEVNYPALLPAIYEAGYTGYVGAEYKPVSDTDSGLGWRSAY